jgi:predicted enzyme related to lactoylglutathione lyase
VDTADVPRLAGFYELVTGASAVRVDDDFAELAVGQVTIAMGSTRTVPLFAPGSAQPGANRSLITEFLVDDVDAEYARLKGEVAEVVNEPTTMPWGNRSLLFRDPDGNLVNLFTPVTPEARERLGR